MESVHAAWQPLLVAFALSVGGANGAAQGERPAALPPGVDGSTHTSYYEVHGRTVAEIAADIRRRGPADSAGTFRSAFTESRLAWRFVARPDGAVCRASDVRVTIAAEVLMPKWVPPADTEPGLAAKWNQSLAGLARHEAGHSAIVVTFATAIRDRLAKVRTRCDRITAEANQAGNALVTEMRSAQAQYDAETLNGLTQGTAFPPRRVL